jgi:hypothetical protein
MYIFNIFKSESFQVITNLTKNIEYEFYFR